MILTVKFPECKKNQKTQPRKGNITNSVKKCVYCGHSFKVWNLNPLKNNIVRREQ